MESAKVFFDQIGPIGALLFSGLSLGISLAAFLGKWGFKEASAENKIRRDFGTSTAKRIAKLADQHYWAIANAAGTLSTGLRSFLQSIEIRLYVPYASGADLRTDVERDAVATSFATFPSLVQLLWSLHNFQFIGSNDYLLPQEEAGNDLRRLYNSFRTSLKSSDGDDLVTGVLQSIRKTDGKFDIQATLDAASIRSKLRPDKSDHAPLADARMEELRAAWARWLGGNPTNVLTATRSLEGFSRRLRGQITELYGDWYNARTRTLFGISWRRAGGAKLSPAEREAVEMAREWDDLMQPLRQAAQGPVPPPEPVVQPQPKQLQPIDPLPNAAASFGKTSDVAAAAAELAVKPNDPVSNAGASARAATETAERI